MLLIGFGDGDRVMVNGEPVRNPEFFHPETNPGYGEVVYAFRPERSGSYRVKVTPVYEHDGPSYSCVVDVVDEQDGPGPPSNRKAEQPGPDKTDP